MAIVVFHESDDDHAPFPHRVVIIQPKTVIIRNPDSLKTSRVTYPRQEFVICANCDHWIRRNIPTCSCEYHCHGLGILLAELELEEVESK